MTAPSRPIPRSFGRTVRKLRLEAGLSQIELAERADLNFNFIGSIERAEKQASLESVVRVAKALGLTGAELLRHAGL